MPPEARKHGLDVLAAIGELRGFAAGKRFEDFVSDRALQLIAERELEIIGEALARWRRLDPALPSSLPQVNRVIGMRNILAHGYDSLDDEILWDVVVNHLHPLEEAVRNCLQ